MSTPGSTPEFSMDASDIIRLMLGYLTSVGFHESARTLRQESGIGLSAQSLLSPALPTHIRHGEWGSVSRALQLSQNPHPPRIQEQVILELAENGQPKSLVLAQSLLALAREELDQITTNSAEDGEDGNTNGRLTKARSLEQRLAAIAANPKKYSEGSSARSKLLYGPRLSKQERRNRLAAELEQETTPVPLNRLVVLLQQACKWQSWTGQLPFVKTDTSTTTSDDDKKKRKKKRKHYDLLLGTASADSGIVVGDGAAGHHDDLAEPIPSDILAKVKFGKSAVCEAACFVRNGLITASSDGLIEIWDTSYQELNTGDYAFQADDSVMGHDTAVLAMSVSNDQTLLASGDATGIVKLWKLATGTCLRQYQAQASSITALDWSRDGTRLLTASAEGVCREFGIVSQHVLQEYTGHTSYIHTCRYVLGWNNKNDATQWIATSSADGTARLWRQGQCLKIWQPQGTVKIGASMAVDPTNLLSESPAIATVLQVPTAGNQLLVVPRAATAYLLDLEEGTVMQTYQADTKDVIFCSATVTPDWVYLCTTGNDCCVFGVSSGRLEQTIRDFTVDSTSKTTSSNVAEISQLLHHPFKPILAAFSNDKTQKKGVLTVWK
jgi:WD40 repeat-containing protein SMU1